MLRDVNERTHEEACGLLFGKGEQVEEVFSVTNILHSPIRFRMDPQEQYHLFMEMEEKGLDLIAIYHSHPSGPSYPSAIDVDEAYYPGVIHLIWAYSEDGWACKAFVIHRTNENTRILEIPIEIYSDVPEPKTKVENNQQPLRG